MTKTIKIIVSWSNIMQVLAIIVQLKSNGIGKPSTTSISTLTWNVKIIEVVLIEIDVRTVFKLSYFAMTNSNYLCSNVSASEITACEIMQKSDKINSNYFIKNIQ